MASLHRSYEILQMHVNSFMLILLYNLLWLFEFVLFVLNILFVMLLLFLCVLLGFSLKLVTRKT